MSDFRNLTAKRIIKICDTLKNKLLTCKFKILSDESNHVHESSLDGKHSQCVQVAFQWKSHRWILQLDGLLKNAMATAKWANAF